MKRQTLILMAVLLTSVTAIAWAAIHEVTGVITVTFQVDPAGAGDVLLSGQKKTSTSAFSGYNMTVSAQANPGYGFVGWYIDSELKGTDMSSFTFKTAETNMTVVAKFEALAASSLTLKVKEGKGSVSFVTQGQVVSEDTRKYTSGSEVTVAAVPEKGNEFVCWQDGNGQQVSSSRSYTFTINNDMTLQAVFKEKEHYNPDLVSFPGAEGYGRFTTGGRAIDDRGSKVYYVTRLDDCADDNLVEGTFRWAVKSGDDTPRTVLFKVSGTIYLTSRLSGLKPNLTIAGQTAPGGGICIGGHQMKLPSNSIVRHIRFRAGDLPNKSMSELDVENVNNVILDHCTFAWSMEENLTMYDCDYTTVQWCIFEEPLYNSRNSKGARAYGAQWGGEHGTMHHCLFAHCVSRAPRFNGVRDNTHDRHVDAEFINNVIFNWGTHNSVYGGECSTGVEGDYNRTYMINNYYKPGPLTKDGTGYARHFVTATGENINQLGEWYLSGNKFETGSKWARSEARWSDEVLEKVNADNYYGFLDTSNKRERAIAMWSAGYTQDIYDQKLLKSLPAGYELTIKNYDTADEAYDKVVKQAGASLPRYDENDARVLQEAAGEIDPQFGGERGAKLGVIDSPTDITLQDHDVLAALYMGDEAKDDKEIDVTFFPRLQGNSFDAQVTDTDGDGLPDAYETEVGLNPNDPADGRALTESGYSNLELFLNGVADRQIDATKYTKHQHTALFTGFNAIVGEGEAYTTVQAAVDAAPADGTPYYIFIRKGEYKGHVAITKANIHLVGQDKRNTIIWDDKTNTDDGGVDKAATINVTGNDVSFDNLTIRNTRTDKQAVAIYTNGDRISITNCNLDGYQDTYRTANKDKYRNLVRNSKISGRTDFIYGTGEVFFDSDTLNIVASGGWIVAPAQEGGATYGYVFRDNVITAQTPGLTTYLGRPWKEKPMVTFIDTQLTEGVSIYPEGWSDMGGLPVQMAECNTVDASGTPLDLSQRKTTFSAEGKSCTSKAVLGKVEADSYQLDYMLRGADNWDADWQAFILPAPAIYVNNDNISWADQTGFAQCYLVIVDGVATITAETSRVNDGKTVTVKCISIFGVTGEEASSKNPTGIQAPKTTAAVMRRSYFTADGRQHQHLQHGLNIIRETLSDGTQRVQRIVAK